MLSMVACWVDIIISTVSDYNQTEKDIISSFIGGSAVLCSYRNFASTVNQWPFGPHNLTLIKVYNDFIPF
jgi:hypothetical protein